MRPSLSSHRYRRALSLVELMIVITIVSLLCLMAWRGYTVFVKRGESAACIQKMANFGAALQGYVAENKGWPQEGEAAGPNQAKPSEDQLWTWWFKTMKGYGIGNPDDWMCPSDLALRKKEKEVDEEDGKNESATEALLKNPSYIPAKFGPGPFAPFENSNQPWLIEQRGHFDGMYKVMPNGTVQKEVNFKAVNRVPAGGSK